MRSARRGGDAPRSLPFRAHLPDTNNRPVMKLRRLARDRTIRGTPFLNTHLIMISHFQNRAAPKLCDRKIERHMRLILVM